VERNHAGLKKKYSPSLTQSDGQCTNYLCRTKFGFPAVAVRMGVQTTCTWVTSCMSSSNGVNEALGSQPCFSRLELGTPQVGKECGRRSGDAPSPLRWRQNIGQGGVWQTPFRVRLKMLHEHRATIALDAYPFLDNLGPSGFEGVFGGIPLRFSPAPKSSFFSFSPAKPKHHGFASTPATAISLLGTVRLLLEPSLPRCRSTSRNMTKNVRP